MTQAASASLSRDELHTDKAKSGGLAGAVGTAGEVREDESLGAIAIGLLDLARAMNTAANQLVFDLGDGPTPSAAEAEKPPTPQGLRSILLETRVHLSSLDSRLNHLHNITG